MCGSMETTHSSFQDFVTARSRPASWTVTKTANMSKSPGGRCVELLDSAKRTLLWHVSPSLALQKGLICTSYCRFIHVKCIHNETVKQLSH